MANRPVALDAYPTLRYVIGVAKGGAAGLVLYALFLAGELVVEFLSTKLSVASSGPAMFLRLALSWGGALTSAATWAVVSYSELRELVRARRIGAAT